jgi:P27 family predicted phage terminase small subunit
MPATKTPTRVKVLSGNPGKRAINKKEPQPNGLPKQPPIMSEVAKKFWVEVVTSMPPGVYTTADSHLLASYCETAAMIQQLTAAIIEAPLVTTGSTGQDVVNPLIKQRADQQRLLVQTGQRLGLDPIARQAIDGAASGGNAQDEGFGAFH